MCHILKEPLAHDASPGSSSPQNRFETQPCPFPCNGKKWSRLDYTIVPLSWCRININQLDSVIDFLINKAFVSACITTQSLMAFLPYLKSWLYVCGFAPAPRSPVARLAGLSLTRGGDRIKECFTSLSGETKCLSSGWWLQSQGWVLQEFKRAGAKRSSALGWEGNKSRYGRRRMSVNLPTFRKV